MDIKREEPANRLYVFAKNCTNSHGTFLIGDKARGAFSKDLIKSYLEAGILVAQSQKKKSNENLND